MVSLRGAKRRSNPERRRSTGLLRFARNDEIYPTFLQNRTAGNRYTFHRSGWRLSNSNLNLPADLHEILRRKVEAVDGVDRVAIQKREQPAPPGGEPRLLLARHHAVALAEIDRVVRIDRTVRLLPVQRHGHVRDFDKAEANGHVPETLS